MGQVFAICCRKDDGQLALEFLRQWDPDMREDGEWMEPVEEKSRNSGRDEAREGVPPRPSEEWAGWLHAIDNLDRLDVDDLDAVPCPDEELEAAVNKADFRGVGPLYCDDSVLMALKKSNKAKENVREDTIAISNLSSDGDAAPKQAKKQAETKAHSSAASNPQSGHEWEKEPGRKIDVPERSSKEYEKETDGDAVRDGDGKAPQPVDRDDGAPPPRDLGGTRSPSTSPLAGPAGSWRDLALLAGARLTMRMESAEGDRLDSAGWDDSADWGDTALVAPRPTGFAQKMSDIAEDQEKSWEGSSVPSGNSAEGGEGAGPRADGDRSTSPLLDLRAAFNKYDSTSLLMSRMEELGDELLAEVEGWEDDEDDGGADDGEAGGRREGPRPARRNTNAMLLRMDTLNAELAEEMDKIDSLNDDNNIENPRLNVELAAEMDRLNDDGDDEKTTPSAVSMRDTADRLNGMDDLGDAPMAPRKTALEGLPKEAAMGDENEKGEEKEAARATPQSDAVESETSRPPPAAEADGHVEGTKKGKKRRSLLKRLSTKLPSPRKATPTKVLSRGK